MYVIAGIVIVALIIIILAIILAMSDNGVDDKKPKRHFEHYDFIVIGGGTAGATAAWKLSEYYKVLVLEVGQNRNDNEEVLGLPGTVQNNNNLAIPVLSTETDSGRLAMLTGKMWGGSSGINFAHALRPSNEYIDYLSQYFADINPEDVKHFYKEIETYVPIEPGTSSPERGHDGPIFVSQVSADSETQNAAEPLWEAVAQVAGIEIVDDYNLYQHQAVSRRSQLTYETFNGFPTRRSFAGNDILGEIVDDEGYGIGIRKGKLRIISGMAIDKLHICKDSVSTITAYKDNQAHHFTCDKVVLAAGIFTPSILERSGYGNPEILKAAKVEHKITNMHIGEHLTTHYGALIPVEVPIEWLASIPTSWFIDVDAPHDDINRRQMQIIISGGEPISPTRAVMLLGAFALDSTSEGYMHITGPTLLDQPKVKFGLWETEHDVQTSVAIVRKLQEIIQTVNQNVGPGTMQLMIPADTDEEIVNFYKQNTVVTCHYSGMCGLGSVIDSNFKVMGLSNVYVCDLNIYPIAPDSNTSLPAYISGLMFASQWVEDKAYCGSEYTIE